MAEIKTRQTEQSVAEYLDAIEPAQKREDAKIVCAMMERLSGHPPKMWGPSIIGFGSYHYKYDSGHSGVMCRSGFSPRKAQLVFYIDAPTAPAEMLARLGKHKTGKSCLYVNKLADVDIGVLEELIADGLARADVAFPE